MARTHRLADTGPDSLTGRTLALGVLGAFCLAMTTVVAMGGLPADPWLKTGLGLVLAAAAGFVVRGLRRRAWFGSRVSLHQSLSFEVVVQAVQWLSPSLSSRAFETEFLIRETGIDRQEVSAWMRSRRVALPAVVSAVACSLWLSQGYAVAGMAYAALAMAALVLGLGQAAHTPGTGARGRAHLAATAMGLWVWGLEGALFCLAVQPLFDWTQALLLYVAFTAAVEAAIAPLALGVAQLPALLALSWAAGPAALAVLVMFHAARLGILLLLGMLYLPRYKLTVDDLLDRGLIARLAASQRPAGGWRLNEENPAGLELSVVIPAYNEALRLPPYLESVVRHLKDSGLGWEVLVVDDGSKDDTREIVRAFAAVEPRVRLVCNPTNLGKGGAVAHGVSKARGLYVLFADADGATPATEIDRLLPALREGSEIAIGSRRVTDVAVTLRRDSLRSVLGSLFYTLVNFLAVPGIRDTQCGFKAFRRDAARRLFDRLSETGWAFDVEVLYRAQMVGYAVAEVPVNWQEIDGSKVDPFRDAIRMAKAILSIRHRNAGFLRRVPSLSALPDTTARVSA